MNTDQNKPGSDESNSNVASGDSKDTGNDTQTSGAADDAGAPQNNGSGDQSTEGAGEGTKDE